MKYYISFGGLEKIIQAETPYKACMKILRIYFSKYRDVLPLTFRVSQRGFNIHNDDEIITTDVIIGLFNLSNNFEESVE